MFERLYFIRELLLRCQLLHQDVTVKNAYGIFKQILQDAKEVFVELRNYRNPQRELRNNCELFMNKLRRIQKQEAKSMMMTYYRRLIREDIYKLEKGYQIEIEERYKNFQLDLPLLDKLEYIHDNEVLPQYEYRDLDDVISNLGKELRDKPKVLQKCKRRLKQLKKLYHLHALPNQKEEYIEAMQDILDTVYVYDIFKQDAYLALEYLAIAHLFVR